MPANGSQSTYKSFVPTRGLPLPAPGPYRSVRQGSLHLSSSGWAESGAWGFQPLAGPRDIPGSRRDGNRSWNVRSTNQSLCPGSWPTSYPKREVFRSTALLRQEQKSHGEVLSIRLSCRACERPVPSEATLRQQRLEGTQITRLLSTPEGAYPISSTTTSPQHGLNTDGPFSGDGCWEESRGARAGLRSAAANCSGAPLKTSETAITAPASPARPALESVTTRQLSEWNPSIFYFLFFIS